MLAVIIGVVLLSSCTSNYTDETTVSRKLISAKAYKHPTKKSTKEDIQTCQKSVPTIQVDDCMSEQGWVVSSKRYN